jgi:TonB family protein
VQFRFALCTVAMVFGLVPILPSATHTIAGQSTRTFNSHEVFARVYSVDTPDLVKPVTIRLGRVLPDQKLSEIGARTDLEITVGVDGLVRDAMVKKSSGDERVEADAIRAAFNSQFRAGTLRGKPVAVRIPLSFSVPRP